MTLGPGKYDEYCTLIRERTGARFVAVIVVGAKTGEGFSIQGEPELMAVLPDVLRMMATDMDAERAARGGN